MQAFGKFSYIQQGLQETSLKGLQVLEPYPLDHYTQQMKAIIYVILVVR